ncbi:MAG: AAA family ATPase, partial [Actinomycetota bacterium]
MRPERLEMAGFAPFRQPTEVDFRGLEIFALTGPTGAGKSSVIDAITFALYGSVSRYGRRSVGPVVTLGAAEARVRFDFEVEGVSYSAARVVRRTPGGGATTAEARLEGDGAVLASGAAEVTEAVESLLGLGIEHFTRSVVLPQGEFAAFLHDTPAGQQDLVKALLDMGVLDTVRRMATERARTAEAVADQARVRLDQLQDATPEAEKAAARRLQRTESLIEPVQSAEEAIAESEEAVKSRRARVEELGEQHRLVSSVSVPEGVAELARKLSLVEDDMARARERHEEAARRREEAQARVDELPSVGDLEAGADLERSVKEARARRDGLDLKRLEADLTAAEQEVEAATRARREAQAALDEARARHAGHALTVGLSQGDPCPICDRPLPSDPAAPSGDLADCQGQMERAEQSLADATAQHRTRERSLTEARATHDALTEQIAEQEDRLKRLPDVGDRARAMEARREADRALSEARSEVSQAEEALARLQEQHRGLDESVREAWESFAATRDRLAPLGPPPAERDDLGRAWRDLDGWAGAR